MYCKNFIVAFYNFAFPRFMGVKKDLKGQSVQNTKNDCTCRLRWAREMFMKDTFKIYFYLIKQ